MNGEIILTMLKIEFFHNKFDHDQKNLTMQMDWAYVIITETIIAIYFFRIMNFTRDGYMILFFVDQVL